MPSVSSGKPEQVTVTAKKAKGAKGYQLWASTSKKFDQAAYGLVSAKSAKATATLSGLPEGKKVFVKARLCRQVVRQVVGGEGRDGGQVHRAR